MSERRTVVHGRVALALFELRPGPTGAEPLLLLHELGSSSRAWDGEPWPGTGAVYALDLAGHGASDDRPGAAYTPELFAADVDAALAALGPCRLVGAGLGAYVALLVAGARPELVPRAVLLPGRGLAGGGEEPVADMLAGFARDLELCAAGRPSAESCHPAVWSCERDVRPADYARDFARAARSLVLLEDGEPRPAWWRAAREVPAARVTSSRPDAIAAVAASV